MEKFIQLLKQKGIVDRLQFVVNRVPLPKTKDPCVADKATQEAVKEILLHECKIHEDLTDALFDGATDMFLDAVVKELNIHKDPDFKGKELTQDELAQQAIQMVIANILFQ